MTGTLRQKIETLFRETGTQIVLETGALERPEIMASLTAIGDKLATSPFVGSQNMDAPASDTDIFALQAAQNGILGYVAAARVMDQMNATLDVSTASGLSSYSHKGMYIKPEDAQAIIDRKCALFQEIRELEGMDQDNLMDHFDSGENNFPVLSEIAGGSEQLIHAKPFLRPAESGLQKAPVEQIDFTGKLLPQVSSLSEKLTAVAQDVTLIKDIAQGKTPGFKEIPPDKIESAASQQNESSSWRQDISEFAADIKTGFAALTARFADAAEGAPVPAQAPAQPEPAPVIAVPSAAPSAPPPAPPQPAYPQPSAAETLAKYRR